MATRKQLVELLKEYVESTGAFKDDDPIDYNDEEDFDFILHETLDELGACKGCRWYFDADRSCEKTNDCNRTCVNRLYNQLVAMKNLDAISEFMKGVELKSGNDGIDYCALAALMRRIISEALGTNEFEIYKGEEPGSLVIELSPEGLAAYEALVQKDNRGGNDDNT